MSQKPPPPNDPRLTQFDNLGAEIIVITGPGDRTIRPRRSPIPYMPPTPPEFRRPPPPKPDDPPPPPPAAPDAP